MRDRQKESDVVQGMSAKKVSGRRHVEERFALRPPIQLVQNSLSAPTAAIYPRWRRQRRGRVASAVTGSVAVVFRFRAQRLGSVTAVRKLCVSRDRQTS